VADTVAVSGAPPRAAAGHAPHVNSNMKLHTTAEAKPPLQVSHSTKWRAHRGRYGKYCCRDAS
jgi:hypothetical protein